MSLVNIIIRSDRQSALAIADSRISGMDGQGHTSKLLPLPHLDGALAVVGNLAVLGIAHGAALNEQSFDGMGHRFAAKLTECWQELHRQYPVVPREQEVAVVAWSDAAQGFRIGQWRQTEDQDFTYSSGDEAFVTPGDDEIANQVDGLPTDEAGLIRLAEIQVESTRRRLGAHWPIGGNLYVGRLERGSIDVRLVKDRALIERAVENRSFV